MDHFPVARESVRSREGRLGRRRFLGILGAGTGAAAVAASLGFRSDGNAGREMAAGPMAGMTHSEAAGPSGVHQMTAEAMDSHHRAGVEAFERNRLTPITAGVGAADAPFRMEGGRRTFELTAARTP